MLQGVRGQPPPGLRRARRQVHERDQGRERDRGEIFFQVFSFFVFRLRFYLFSLLSRASAVIRSPLSLSLSISLSTSLNAPFFKIKSTVYKQWINASRK